MNSKPSVYILGASGYMGSILSDYLSARKYQVFENKVDVRSPQDLKRAFNLFHPDVVINFAGVRTEPNIDWCESHKLETVEVNVAGAINVMSAALEAGAYPIQISSGCIYSAWSAYAYTEEDEPNFLGNFYSRMKITLEKALAELPVLCARIRLPISSQPHPKNLLNKLIAYKTINSAPNSITLLEDLWPALEDLMYIRPTGILNLTNEGYVEYEDIVEAYVKIVDPGHKYKMDPTGLTETGNRSNCVLSQEKALTLGVKMPCLDDDRLEKIMLSYKDNLLKQLSKTV